MMHGWTDYSDGWMKVMKYILMNGSMVDEGIMDGCVMDSLMEDAWMNE